MRRQKPLTCNNTQQIDSEKGKGKFRNRLVEEVEVISIQESSYDIFILLTCLFVPIYCSFIMHTKSCN